MFEWVDLIGMLLAGAGLGFVAGHAFTSRL